MKDSIINTIFEKLSFEDDRFIKSLNAVYLLSGSVHLVFLVIFIKFGVTEMQIFNYFSPLLYLLCFLLNRKKYIVPGAVIGLLEVTLHGFSSTVFLGWNSGFHYYMLLAFLLIFFLFKTNVFYKIMLAIPVMITLIWLYVYCSQHPPKYILDPGIISAFHINNLLITISVISIFALFYTAYLRKMEDDQKNNIKEMRLTQDILRMQIEKNVLMQDELWKEKRLLDAIMDNLPDYIYFKDKESRFTRISKSMKKLFTVDHIEDMIGKTDFDFHTPKEALKRKQDEENIIKTRIALVDQLTHEFLLNGVEQWVNTTKFPLIDHNNKCIGTFGISKDVTYLKKLELEAQFQAHELRLREEELKIKENEQRYLNQQKIKYFSILSHDLKNPLNALLGFTQLLWENYDKYDEARKKKMLGHLVKVTDNLQGIIINLLDWSRSQLNTLHVEPTVINMKSLLAEVVDLYTIQQELKHIHTSVLAEDIEFLSDKDILLTVIRNLYSNALKFTHLGGQIVISAAKETNEVVVKVTDNGIGMSQTEIKQLFSLGDNNSRAGTLDEKGTGLGLIVCKEYLSKCGGTLEVSSIIDKGSTFTIRLPLAPGS
jgi:PAS domain S-box-containing protein